MSRLLAVSQVTTQTFTLIEFRCLHPSTHSLCANPDIQDLYASSKNEVEACVLSCHLIRARIFKYRFFSLPKNLCWIAVASSCESFLHCE